MKKIAINIRIDDDTFKTVTGYLIEREGISFGVHRSTFEFMGKKSNNWKVTHLDTGLSIPTILTLTRYDAIQYFYDLTETEWVYLKEQIEKVTKT